MIDQPDITIRLFVTLFEAFIYIVFSDSHEVLYLRFKPQLELKETITVKNPVNFLTGNQWAYVLRRRNNLIVTVFFSSLEACDRYKRLR